MPLAIRDRSSGFMDYGPDYIAPVQSVSAGIHFVAGGVAGAVAWRTRELRAGLSGPVKAASRAFWGSALLLFFSSGMYHALPRGSASNRLFHRLDHVGVMAVFVALVVCLVCWHRQQRGSTLLQQRLFWSASLVMGSGVLAKLFLFEQLLGWPGLLFYIALFSLAGFYAAREVRHEGARATRALWLGIAGLLLFSLAERMQFPNLWPGVFGPHELLHVASSGWVISLALYFNRRSPRAADSAPAELIRQGS